MAHARLWPVPTLRSPVLVGRRAELATAFGLVDAAARGHGGALLVTGEAGIGKSRLVDELRGRAAAAGMTVLVGRSVDGGGTYRAVTEALARLLRTRVALDDPALRPYRAALRRLLPGIADEPLASAPDTARPTPRSCSAKGCCACWPGSRTLLVLEDLHWADPDTLDLVRYLAGALVDAPVLLVATARDDVARPALARLAADVRTLPLHRLDAEGVAALAAACRGAPLPAAEREELVARADGLPLLVEELLAVGSDAGAAVDGGARGGTAGGPAAVGAQVVLAAAVVDDTDWRLLAAVADPSGGGHGATNEVEGAVVAALRAAADVGLLVVADGRLRFRHALTRDAVLATLLPPERAALAARAARVLDARGDRALAARLYRESGDPARGAEIFVELARADVGPRRRAQRRRLPRRGGRARRAHRARARADPARPRRRGPRRPASPSSTACAVRNARSCACGSPAPRSSPGRWADARRHVENAGRPDDPRSMVLIADAAYGAGDVAQAERLARTAAETVRDPALLCEALIGAGPQHVHRRSRGVRRGAAARRPGRRRARPAVLAGAGPVRAGQPRAHPRRPGRALPRRRARAGAGGGHARRRRADGPAAGQRHTARRRPRAPPSRSCAAPPNRPDGCGSPACRRWPSCSRRSTPGSRATSRP